MLLGNAGLLESILLVAARLGLHSLQRAVRAPTLAQLDEGVVTGQPVHGIEQERDVVEVQVLNALAAQFKELLAEHVGVGNDDRVHRIVFSLPGETRGHDVALFVRIVRQVRGQLGAEHRLLHQAEPRSGARIRSRPQQGDELGVGIAVFSRREDTGV